MDFFLNEEQRTLRQAIVKFAAGELGNGIDQRDRSEEFWWDGWKKCAAFGLTGLGIPEEHGGGGADPLALMVALEALGFACPDNGLVFAIANHLLSCAMPIVRWGTPKQKARYLPALADGRLIGAHAMTEPQAGSDTSRILATATRRGDRFLLNARKMFITNAPIADLVVVFARISAQSNLGNFSAFLVERSCPGFSLGAEMSKMGLRTAPMAEICLDECEVPEESALGPLGSGALVFSTAQEWERAYLSACNLGALKRQFEACVSYSRERRQFGRPIGSFQTIAHRLADIRVNIELAELLLHKIACLRQAGKSTFFESSMAKLFIAESYAQGSLAILQAHGAYGYMTASGVERNVRDSLASTLYAGTSEVQREIIAEWLGLRAQH